MPKLSVIILSYNTRDVLIDCIKSVLKSEDISFEIIVVDNASTDGSSESVLKIGKENKNVHLVQNDDNIGFARGNNSARKFCKGEYILFLNSDTIVLKDSLKRSFDYIAANSKVGAMTCRVDLPSGSLDLDTRRSFPTPWVAFSHFSYLDRIFPKSKFFAKYWYGYIPDDVSHRAEVIQGAFFLARKHVLDQVGWFDEDYFLDGEDIDLCWKIWEKGYQIMYYPEAKIVHLKGVSKGKKNKNKVPFAQKVKFRLAGVNAMEIFYRKRLWSQYPFYINWLVLLGISIMKLVRIGKLLLL